jgi:hypothetical protein
MSQIIVRSYRTMQILATVAKGDFTAWCSANKVLPHHSTNNGGVWYVIE